MSQLASGASGSGRGATTSYGGVNVAPAQLLASLSSTEGSGLLTVAESLRANKLESEIIQGLRALINQ